MENAEVQKSALKGIPLQRPGVQNKDKGKHKAAHRTPSNVLAEKVSKPI